MPAGAQGSFKFQVPGFESHSKRRGLDLETVILGEEQDLEAHGNYEVCWEVQVKS